MRIAVCWKWVAVDRDRASTEDPDRRWAGVSLGDRAALEIALRLAGADGHVTVLSLGTADADRCLRDALAAGAHAVTRIDAPTRYEGRVVAAALAAAADGADLVIAGDYSIDRGTGAVPAFIAAELGFAQALGLVEVDTGSSARADRGAPSPSSIKPSSIKPSSIKAVRRLDGGRREILDIPIPAVLSVEGAAATLRRASLAASLATADAEIPVLPHPVGEPPKIEVHAPRPRPRNVHVPAGSTLTRVRDLLQIGGATAHVETVELDPPAAAARIVDQLRAWGYLDPVDG